MKLSDLIVENVSDEYEGTIVDLLLSLKGKGKEKVSSSSFHSHVSKMGINVDFETMVDFLNTLPMVKMANEMYIEIGDESSYETDTEEESDGDRVEAMADNEAIDSIKD